MGRYYEHDEEIRAGQYPKIHEKLKASIDLNDIKDKSVLDLGGCTGAMSLWALREGARDVVLNDMSYKYLQLYTEYHAIHKGLYGFTGNAIVNNQKVDMSSDFTVILPKIDTLIARRIIYELRDDVVRDRFVKQMIQAGVTTVYLQGLVRVRNHKEPLWNVELEAQTFIDNGFKVVSYNQNDIMKLVR